MPKTPIAADTAEQSINPALLAFKPRQVQLVSKRTTMNQENSTQKTLLSADQRSHLLLSVAQYLESNGFSKTLKKFLSEASLQKDDLDGSVFDLEEMFCKFLEIRVHNVTKFESNKVQENVSQRQRKEKQSEKRHDDAMDREDRASDGIIDSKSTKETVRLDALPTAIKTKEKKKKKKNSNSPDQEEQVKVELHKEPANNIVCENSHKKCKDKKKKIDSELLPGTTEETPIDAVVSEGKKIADFETENQSKDKKKKKNKLSSDPVDDVGEHLSEGNQVGQLKKGESLKDSQVVDSVIVNADNVMLENRKAKSEGKKKKKDHATTESVCGGDLKELERKWKENDSTKDDSRTASEVEKQAKNSKKRKRLASEESAGQFADGKQLEDTKCGETEVSEEPNMSERPKKLKSSSRSGEKEEGEKTSSIVSIESQKTPAKQLDGWLDGNLEKSGEKSAMQSTMMKQQNGSVQPKLVKHFQRIKADDVVFSDERLKDNSYWAKDGAADGYGVKAQEVLGQVKGRDFRHEKTKKKRGSYRGGQIDLQSHSVKFNYSDED
uniref:Srp40 C-terminal domain-containing protein n=1 Tax=Rhizophora mucronata TaxID=61149 RepID=A0A2P2JH52_RHIMU